MTAIKQLIWRYRVDDQPLPSHRYNAQGYVVLGFITPERMPDYHSDQGASTTWNCRFSRMPTLSVLCCENWDMTHIIRGT
jgi:hypothetical protein